MFYSQFYSGSSRGTETFLGLRMTVGDTLTCLKAFPALPNGRAGRNDGGASAS
jgi:hypothetical protein